MSVLAEPLISLAAGGRPPVLPEDLWPGIIGPPGVTNWAGAGKAGKGLAWADVAARVSRGWPFPPLSPDDPRVDWPMVPTPGKVIIVSTEDAPEVVWHRVNAAGGDMSRIYNLTSVPVSGGEPSASETFSLPRDFGYLEEQIAMLADVRLVILDNLMSIASSTVSFNQQVRRNYMTPLETIGRNYGVRIVLVNHFTKGLPKDISLVTKNLSDYIYGSLGVIQAARLTTVFLPDGRTHAITTYAANGKPAERPVRYIIDGDGEDVHLLWEQPPLMATDPEAMPQLVDQVLHVLAGLTRPATDQELAAWLHVPNPQIRHALAVAEEEGRVHRERGAWYVLALGPAEADQATEPGLLLAS